MIYLITILLIIISAEVLHRLAIKFPPPDVQAEYRRIRKEQEEKLIKALKENPRL